jgi:hypothetical protein
MSIRLMAASVAILFLPATGAVGEPSAKPAAAEQDFSLPRAYLGYSQPEIKQCSSKGPLESACVIPPMTAGRYLILARGAATSTGANATQAIEIALNGQACAATSATPFTGKKALSVACAVSLLMDKQATVTAVYKVVNGSPEPRGPDLELRRVPWNGIVMTNALKVQTREAPAQPAKP